MNDPARADAFSISRTGIGLYALGTVAAGVFDLLWREFEPAHQPIGALGDHVPGQEVLAYITAIVMIAGGAAVLWPRTRRLGALATAPVYLMFALFWLPRFYTVPQIFGFRPGVFAALLAQVFTQLIVVAGALLLYAPVAPPQSRWRHTAAPVARWTFGVGSFLFGVAHFVALTEVSRMIPGWMPLPASVWVVVSGVGFVLAGVAILIGRADMLAARLLAVMLLAFEVILVPAALTHPHMHVPWGSNAYNLAAAGATWMFADAIATGRQRTWGRALARRVRGAGL